MDRFKLYTQEDLLELVNKRPGEIKLGERLQTIASLDDLSASTANFVLIGIPESIGVRANLGIGGTETTFLAALRALLNVQCNAFLNGDELLLLGHFIIQEPEDQSLYGLRQKTEEIDQLVSPVIFKIIASGKIPIIIGGGHNNAAPIIEAAAKAKGAAINVVNIDAHADLRDIGEGRHSGNAFSFALQQGKLSAYRIFGLHQNYVQQDIAASFAVANNIKAVYFDDMLASPFTVVQHWIDFVADLEEPCGLEIDLDSIQNVLSSAATPSGFALNDIRKILLAGSKKYCYLHLCEGAATLADGRSDHTIGKLIAYLVTDFIKALRPRNALQPSS